MDVEVYLNRIPDAEVFDRSYINGIIEESGKTTSANILNHTIEKLIKSKTRITNIETTHCEIFKNVVCYPHKHAMRGCSMDTAKTIKELRESTGMSRKEFSEHTGIPVRTLEDWEAGRRTPPKYIPRLLAYQIKFEGIFSAKGEVKGKRRVSVIKDVDGNNIVIINDIRFKGKRSIDWKDVREYLKEFVGEFYTIAATGDVIYIGSDLPNEYSGSKYTHSIKGANAKAKANAAQGIPELIEIAVGKHFRENNEGKHWRNAKYGWYRYDSRFALPVYNETGEIERYNVFHASLIVRHSEDKKLYLYDILDIKKETSNPIEP